MSLKLAFCLVLLSYVAAQHHKSGQCPRLEVDFLKCSLACYSDSDCEGSAKCCRTSCGGTACAKPLVPKVVANGKSGYCPNPPTGPWVCTSRCSIDKDCHGSKKCCKNRCGAMACVKPETEPQQFDY
ncbi:WAP four-disulfide core domain protein 2 [Aethina tumida]|uniref:WAP four-disulfide core domain protein 2 n=1 Tax=Aethina tumida TaxID=116153 RepID=UPI00096B0407|nr:WAP four-disulfide core domain protein 2 [Aethina tumida]